MYQVNLFSNVFNDTNVSVSSGAVTDLMSSLTATKTRQGLIVTNCDSAAICYCKVAAAGSSPTVTSTNFHFKLSPSSEKTIMCGPGLSVFVRTDTAGSTKAQIVEVA